MTAVSTAGPRGRFVDVNDARLYCEEHGAGASLLLRHGGLESSASWAGVVPLLATRFHIVIPDSRGHCRSSDPAGRLSYRQLADDVVGQMSALRLDRPYVGGWSDGGQVALEIGLRYPDAARALVVGDSFFDFGEGFRGSVREVSGMDATGAIDVGRLEAALGESLHRFCSMHAGGEDEWHAFLGRTAHMWLEYPGLPEADFGRIGAPTLVVVGDRDEVVRIDILADQHKAADEVGAKEGEE